MSLRIYIKGTPKFNSPKRSEQSIALSPHLNRLPSPRIPQPSKKAPVGTIEPRESSVMFELSPPRSDHPLRSSDENSMSVQNLAKKEIKRDKSHQSVGSVGHGRGNRQTKTVTKDALELRNKQDIQKAMRDFRKKLYNRENVPERQLRGIIKESDNMILSLFEEMERLNELLTEKMKENEFLRNLNPMTSISVKDFKFKGSIEDEDNIAFEGTRRIEDNSLQENAQISETIKKLTHSNAELNEQVTVLREMIKTNEQTSIKERESFNWLKGKAEQLMNVNDEMTIKLQEKEHEINRLILEMSRKDQIIDELRREIQSPQYNPMIIKVRDELNNTISPLSGAPFGGFNTTMLNTLKMESPRDVMLNKDNTKEELRDLQKKFDISKSDNAKLMKIIEGNQQVIKGLKETLSDLERKNNTRFEEMKVLYESKIKTIRFEKVSGKGNTETELTNETLTKMTSGGPNSLSSSQIAHSKKASNESVWKGRNDVSVGMAY